MSKKSILPLVYFYGRLHEAEKSGAHVWAAILRGRIVELGGTVPEKPAADGEPDEQPRPSTRGQHLRKQRSQVVEPSQATAEAAAVAAPKPVTTAPPAPTDAQRFLAAVNSR